MAKVHSLKTKVKFYKVKIFLLELAMIFDYDEPATERAEKRWEGDAWEIHSECFVCGRHDIHIVKNSSGHKNTAIFRTKWAGERKTCHFNVTQSLWSRVLPPLLHLPDCDPQGIYHHPGIWGMHLGCLIPLWASTFLWLIICSLRHKPHTVHVPEKLRISFSRFGRIYGACVTCYWIDNIFWLCNAFWIFIGQFCRLD